MRSDSSQPTAFRLKGSVLTLSVLQLLSLDYSLFAQQLATITQKNPNFFNHMPIIIDLQKIYASTEVIDFAQLCALLKQFGLVPVGLINANSQQAAAAVQYGLGILPKLKTTKTIETPPTVERSLVITQPVRSGQQIYAKKCDLIVLASVSNGAEILSDGNIHVYGTLRGRAIAGVNGDLQARIFCNKLEAELISIAGYYKLQEELIKMNHLTTASSTTIHIFLEDEQLIIACN